MSKQYVVFQPGGYPSKNVYVTEETLSLALAGTVGVKIFLDFSYQDDGSYTFETVGELDLGRQAVWTDEGFEYTIIFGNETTLAQFPYALEGALNVTVNQDTPVYTVTEAAEEYSLTGNAQCFVRENATIEGGTSGGTLLKVTNGGSGNVYFHVYTTAEGANSVPLFTTDTGNNSQMALNLFDGTFLGVDAIGGGDGCSVNINSSGSGVDASLFPIVHVYGGEIFDDTTGTAISTIPAANALLLFDVTTGILWRSDGTTWFQLAPSSP